MGFYLLIPSDTDVYNGSCLVYVVGPKKLLSVQVDCLLSACYFKLLACARGLGTSWIGLGRFIEDPEILNLIVTPDDHQIVAPIVLGYPRDILDVPDRMGPQNLKSVT